jgi:glycosyltransferase involved in cell wall biosynthesis
MSKSLISILLPVHDDSPFLEKCLLSLNKLILPAVTELLIVADRVSNRNLDLINQFNSPLRKRVLINNKHGLVESLNQGIVAAEGEYIARIDHDDMMESTRIEKQFLFLDNNPEFVLVGSNVMLIDHLDIPIRNSQYPIAHEEITRVLKHKNVLAHPSVMYRKSAVIKAHLYRGFYEGAEDYDLWMRLIRIGKVGNLAECLTFYRQHSDQMSTKNLKKQWIITEAVKTSAKLNDDRATELDAKYESIDDWYNQNLRVKILYHRVRFRGLVSKVVLRKYWSKIVQPK